MYIHVFVYITFSHQTRAQSQDNSNITYYRKKTARSLPKVVKEVDLYSAFIVVPHTQSAQVRITQCYLQITPYLALPHKHSPDGASPD